MWADVARAFAARVGVRLVLLEYPTPPQMMECLKTGPAMLGSSDTILLGLPMSKGFHPRSSNSTTPISYRLARRSTAPLMLTARELALPSFVRTRRP